jgi:hypothetical protein
MQAFFNRDAAYENRIKLYYVKNNPDNSAMSKTF